MLFENSKLKSELEIHKKKIAQGQAKILELKKDRNKFKSQIYRNEKEIRNLKEFIGYTTDLDVRPIVIIFLNRP